MSSVQERIAAAKAKREAEEEAKKRTGQNTAAVLPAHILEARTKVKDITNAKDLYFKRWDFDTLTDAEFQDYVLTPEQRTKYKNIKKKYAPGRQERVQERVRMALGAASAQKKTPQEALLELTQNKEAFLPEVQQYARIWLAARAPGIEGYCPLVNVGNSCYMNASLQLLFSIPELKAVLIPIISNYQTLDLTADADIDCQDNLQENRSLVRVINGLFRAMNAYSHLGVPLRPTTLQGSQAARGSNAYLEIVDTLKLGRQTQEDADEFISRLFDRLFCFQHFSVLRDLFRVFVEDRKECKDPAIQPVPRRDPLVLISLQLDEPSVISVQTALNEFEKREFFTPGNNMLEACAGPGQTKGEAVVKQLRIRLTPTTKYLFLNLKRKVFDFGTMSYMKVNKPIHLDPTITVDGSQFHLRMCIRHSGSSGGGHYEAFLFDPTGHPSIHYNDALIMNLAPGATEKVWDNSRKPPGYIDRPVLELLQENATVLLYEKEAPPPPPAPAPLVAAVAEKKGGKRKTRKLKRKTH